MLLRRGGNVVIVRPQVYPPPTGRVKVWDGSAWVTRTVKVWDGSAWVARTTKVWNGSAWV